jgi:4-hydroxy-tetrahydrodipicolinate synthase
LSPAQREELLVHILKRTAPLPVVANVSDLDLNVIKRLGGVAREHGATGVSVLPPWYFEQAQPDLIEWFVAGGQAARLPLWLYNFPERTGNRIQIGTVSEVCDRTEVGGFKQSGAQQEFMTELAALAKVKPFAVFAGADDRIAESLDLGAVGCISGLANTLPDMMVKVYEAAKSGEPDSALDELGLLRSVVRRFHLVPFPWNQAAIMEARGLNPGALPPTMSRVTRAHYAQLKKETQAMIQQHCASRIS